MKMLVAGSYPSNMLTAVVDRSDKQTTSDQDDDDDDYHQVVDVDISGS